MWKIFSMSMSIHSIPFQIDHEMVRKLPFDILMLVFCSYFWCFTKLSSILCFVYEIWIRCKYVRTSTLKISFISLSLDFISIKTFMNALIKSDSICWARDFVFESVRNLWKSIQFIDPAWTWIDEPRVWRWRRNYSKQKHRIWRFGWNPNFKIIKSILGVFFDSNAR